MATNSGIWGIIMRFLKFKVMGRPPKMKLKKLGILIGSVVLSLAAISTAKADPVSFSNVVVLTSGPSIDLAANPNIVLNNPTINFSLDIHGAPSTPNGDSLEITFQEFGQAAVVQTFQVPLFGGLPSDYSQLFNFQGINPTIAGTPVVLTVTVLNGAGATLQSGTYNFTISQPVPEPATACLLTLGVIGLLYRKKRS
jgi:PEP-CTERM motif